MRIQYAGVDHPKRIAKSLKRALAAQGTNIGLRTCEEIFSKMSGYANWHELRKVCLESSSRFLKDDEAGKDVAAARRTQFIFKLSELAGVSLPVAEDVIDQIKPTGTRAKTPVHEEPMSSPASGR